MSFNFGGSKSKSSSQTSSVENSHVLAHKSSTPTMPDWMAQAIKGQAGNVSALAGGDPSQYVAGPDALQTQGAAAASKLGGDTSWYDRLMGTSAPTVGVGGVGTERVNAPAPIAAQTVNAASYLDGGLDRHLNPFQQNVIDASLADFDFDASRAKAQESLDIADQGGFGGSGVALTRSMSEDARSRGRAAIAAGLRKEGYDTAAGLAGQDADRRQSASGVNAQMALDASKTNAGYAFGASQLNAQMGLDASKANAELGLDASKTNAQLGMDQRQFLAQLGLNQDANSRANVDAMMGAGGQLRDIAQQQRTAPLDLASWAASTFGNLPLQMFVGEDSSGSTDSNATGNSNTNSKASQSQWGMSFSAGDIAAILGAI